jgi:ribosome-associated protein
VDLIIEKKGSDVTLLDIRPISMIADYFVICSGTSERQVQAIVEGVVDEIKAADIRPLHVEGVPSSGWVLMDYGSVIVHIFAPAVREYYQLEKLWSKAKTVVKIQ